MKDKWIILFLIFVIAVLLIAIYIYQRQVKLICRQLRFYLKYESNLMIAREMDGGGIKELVQCLNDMLEKHKKEKRRYLEKEQMISDIYTNLSHDVRTPLTSLDGYFQLLEQCGDSKEQSRYVGIIQERIASLNDMLEELFTYTKLKNETYQMKMERCVLSRILKDTVFSYYDEWMKRGIEPEFDITERPLAIMGNAEALKRMIQNIIKNGLDHGEGHMKISLKREGEESFLCFENDVLYPEKIEEERIFERFYKVDEARSKNSAGLGLFIAKEFVKRMEGSSCARVKGHVFQIEIRFPLID